MLACTAVVPGVTGSGQNQPGAALRRLTASFRGTIGGVQLLLGENEIIPSEPQEGVLGRFGSRQIGQGETFLGAFPIELSPLKG